MPLFTKYQSRMGVDSLMSEDAIKLDIVIPSFRADVTVLNSIRNLSIPKNMIRKIIVVLDDPLHSLPRELEDWSACEDLILNSIVEAIGPLIPEDAASRASWLGVYTNGDVAVLVTM